MSKILLLSDPILATSLILSYDRNRKPSPMHCFSMVRGGQQSTIVPPILYPLSYAPYCHAFMHIFYMIFPLRWLVAWINMGSMQTPFPCQLPRFPNHIICLLSLVGRCPNKRLGSRFVNCVSSYEPTKPPARVWCGIINMRWKQIKVIMKAFSGQIMRFETKLTSSLIYSFPYSFDQKFATPTTPIHLTVLDLPSLLWSTRNAKWIVRIACSRSGHKHVSKLLVDIPIFRMTKAIVWR